MLYNSINCPLKRGAQCVPSSKLCNVIGAMQCTSLQAACHMGMNIEVKRKPDYGVREGVCPVCGYNLNTEQHNNGDGSISIRWRCPNCSEFGEL